MVVGALSHLFAGTIVVPGLGDVIVGPLAMGVIVTPIKAHEGARAPPNWIGGKL
ncbi:MAG: hypothetical protein Q7S72_00400 [Candidatus Taylorbacteria bacterium]|nr:hypothetical protein [Candidatus Taylorbacteria bacterium]